MRRRRSVWVTWARETPSWRARSASDASCLEMIRGCYSLSQGHGVGAEGGVRTRDLLRTLARRRSTTEPLPLASLPTVPGAYSRGSAACRGPESNWRHQHFQCCALPTELPRRQSHVIREGRGSQELGMTERARRPRLGATESGTYPYFGPGGSDRQFNDSSWVVAVWLCGPPSSGSVNVRAAAGLLTSILRTASSS